MLVQRIINAGAGLPLETVRGTANIQAVLRQGWSSPACFVWRSSVLTAEIGSCSLQPITAEYSVMLALKTEKDDGSVEDQAESLSKKLMRIIQGWKPFQKTGFEYVSGDALTALERNLLLWRDTYRLKQFVTKVPDGSSQAEIISLLKDDDVYIWYVATEQLASHSIVIYSANGAMYADPSIQNHGLQSPGVTLNTASQGDSVRIQTSGNIKSPVFVWPIGTALYLGGKGTLTDVPPISGMSWRLASVIKANTIYFEPDQPVWLGT